MRWVCAVPAVLQSDPNPILLVKERGSPSNGSNSSLFLFCVWVGKEPEKLRIFHSAKHVLNNLPENIVCGSSGLQSYDQF